MGTDDIEVETEPDVEAVSWKPVPPVSQRKRKAAKPGQVRRANMGRPVVTPETTSDALRVLVRAGELISVDSPVGKGTPVGRVGVGAGKRKEMSGGGDRYVKL